MGESRYGLMFEGLEPLLSEEEDLAMLARVMVENNDDITDPEAASNNREIPAGYTYLGQFIDHDITADTERDVRLPRDPWQVTNFRSPKFDLDSLYGSGPGGTGAHYDSRGRFVLGTSVTGTPDLTRDEHEKATIPDTRNDENLIVSQIHLAFQRFHNRVLQSEGLSFDQARRITTWHYQWLILHDFLPRIVGEQRTRAIIMRNADGANGRWFDGRRFYLPQGEVFMPVEFSAAAYRFGHSMVRQRYLLTVTEGFTGTVPIFDLRADVSSGLGDLRGSRRRPSGATIQWFRFFGIDRKPGELAPGETATPLVLARALDSTLAHGLATMPAVAIGGAGTNGPGAPLNSLPVRNLLRGNSFGLPSGQAVARHINLSEDQILRARQNGHSNFNGPRVRNLPNGRLDRTVPEVPKPETVERLERVFGDATPLWYYVLKEAEVFERGKRLGEVGGTIVGEVFAGLLFHDPDSFINADPPWTPTPGRFGCRPTGEFGMAELIAFAQG